MQQYGGYYDPYYGSGYYPSYGGSYYDPYYGYGGGYYDPYYGYGGGYYDPYYGYGGGYYSPYYGYGGYYDPYYGYGGYYDPYYGYGGYYDPYYGYGGYYDPYYGYGGGYYDPYYGYGGYYDPYYGYGGGYYDPYSYYYPVYVPQYVNSNLEYLLRCYNTGLGGLSKPQSNFPMLPQSGIQVSPIFQVGTYSKKSAPPSAPINQGGSGMPLGKGNLVYIKPAGVPMLQQQAVGVPAITSGQAYVAFPLNSATQRQAQGQKMLPMLPQNGTAQQPFVIMRCAPAASGQNMFQMQQYVNSKPRQIVNSGNMNGYRRKSSCFKNGRRFSFVPSVSRRNYSDSFSYYTR